MAQRIVSGRMRLRFTLTGTGWARADIEVGDLCVVVTASYLSDALEALVSGAALVGEGKAAVRFSWDEEPGEYRWLIDRESGDTVRLWILSFPELWSDQPDSNGQLELETVQDQRHFVRCVLRAADNVLFEYGLEGYRQQWAAHPYPVAAVERLRATLMPGIFRRGSTWQRRDDVGVRVNAPSLRPSPGEYRVRTAGIERPDGDRADLQLEELPGVDLVEELEQQGAKHSLVGGGVAFVDHLADEKLAYTVRCSKCVGEPERSQDGVSSVHGDGPPRKRLSYMV